MKKTLITIAVILGLVTLFSVIVKNMPITLESEGFLPEFTIDDLITKADIIVIGEVKTILPSRWNGPNGRNDPTNASIEEIAHAGLFTDSLISINQILKGDIVKPVVRVRSFIGETKRVRLINDTEPSFITKKGYLLFLVKDFSATAKVDPGAYISVGAIQGAYEIVDGKAKSGNDEWNLDELIVYIQNKLSEPEVTEIAPSATNIPEATVEETETPILEETATSTP